MKLLTTTLKNHNIISPLLQPKTAVRDRMI